MKLTARVSVCASVALVAALLGTVACEDSSAPTGAGTTGGTTSTSNGGAAVDDEVGGATTGVGGATTGVGGATTGVGGATTGVGGASAAGGATPGVCNYPAASNPPPAGGAQCVAGEAKGGVCTTEGAVCYKTCGPTNASGWKTETCTGGIIAEVSACQWTGTDYSAFRVPALTAIDPTCPATAPQATMACTTAPCVICADATGGYLDSGANLKAGWCTCVNSKWTCGTAATAWPCLSPGVGQPGC